MCINGNVFELSMNIRACGVERYVVDKPCNTERLQAVAAGVVPDPE
jgi:hypothetical protein